MDIKADYDLVFYEPFADFIECQTDQPAEFGLSEFNLETDLFAALRSCLDALAKEQSKPFNREFISATLNEIRDMLITKNADYGGAVFARPVYAPNLPVETAILVRMSDKVARYKSLMRRTGTWESKIDTLKDYIGYGILLTLALYGDGHEERKEEPAPVGKLILFYSPGMTLGDITAQLQNGNISLYPAD